MKRVLLLLVFASFTGWGAFDHCCCRSIPLDGAWEMAYEPYARESVEYPSFKGVRIDGAVPGYWEDMTDAFAAAGLVGPFRQNPFYEVQTLPMTGWAQDTTLPQIYGCFYYRRTVDVDDEGPAVLAFEGVRNQVHVWVNGRFAGFRAGYSTPFELAIPAGLLRKGSNEIVLAVSNNPNLGYCDYVIGLTSRSIYRSTGGVNGKLELRFPKNELADVYVTTAADLATFTVHAAGKVPFDYEIADASGRVVASGKAAGDFTLPTKGLSFWTPENPCRHRLTLRTAEGTYTQLFGLRRLTAVGEKLHLNGKPVYLRGVTEHCYFPKTVHVPRDLGYYRMITAKRKELGFNFVRFHTFVPPVEYLEATDELGMLVHIESPNFVPQPEFAAIVAFARCHPSVVVYCTGNETRIDRIAEAYLKGISDLVHAETDALFSPMSALRGLEYALVPGKDVIVDKPFRHNAERFARVAAFSDLFNSYQLGLTSYSSLNSPGPETLDAWGDAYCGKPRLSHEICIDSSYVDFSLEKLYPPDSPILRQGVFSEIRRQLTAKGLYDRWPVYFRNSCEWMRRIRKFTFEKLRLSRRTVGYDFLGDINTHWHTFGYSVGMMDEFYRLKPGETVGNVLRYNSAAVLLCDLGSDFNVTAGEKRRISLTLSNYGDADVRKARLDVRLETADGKVVWARGQDAVADVPTGDVVGVGDVSVEFPAEKTPRKYLLKAAIGVDDRTVAANEWELYAFPKAEMREPSNVRVVTDISEADLRAAMAKGERVVLLGAGPFKSLASTYRIGMAGRCAGDFATAINDHPVFAGFPHDGYCGWQFRRLMEGGRTVQLEAGVPYAPIVEVASPAKFTIRQASMFEYRVGEGRLFVCSFRFDEADPAAAWLKARILSYAASEAFEPKTALTDAQLAAVIGAPLISGAENKNEARNPGDPSSDVRAGALAQP